MKVIKFGDGAPWLNHNICLYTFIYHNSWNIGNQPLSQESLVNFVFDVFSCMLTEPLYLVLSYFVVTVVLTLCYEMPEKKRPPPLMICNTNVTHSSHEYPVIILDLSRSNGEADVGLSPLASVLCLNCIISTASQKISQLNRCPALKVQCIRIAVKKPSRHILTNIKHYYASMCLYTYDFLE